MAGPRKRKRYSKARKPKVSIDPSPEAFEKAFCQRLGQTPIEWVKAKVESGSQVGSIQYLFEITAAAIAEKYHCTPQAFHGYYAQYLKTREVSLMTSNSRKTYNKLVRDRIPELINASGKYCSYAFLPEQEYLMMLDAKLNEELAEYQQSKSLEELADLLEVMGAVVKARGYTWDDLTALRRKKRAERGGFDKRILLKDVWSE